MRRRKADEQALQWHERFVRLAQPLTTKSKIAILVAWYAYTSL
jgi:hypothetical protein